MYADKPIQVKADHFLSACQGGEKKAPFHLMMNSNFGDEKKSCNQVKLHSALSAHNFSA